VAVQGGQYAAKAILRRVRRQPELPRFQYHDQGSLAVIARWAAVANAFGVQLSGILAWIVWACIHVMHVVTFQNRLLVFMQWALQNLTFGVERGLSQVSLAQRLQLSIKRLLSVAGADETRSSSGRACVARQTRGRKRVRARNGAKRGR
jgi:hypothetical protein